MDFSSNESSKLKYLERLGQVKLGRFGSNSPLGTHTSDHTRIKRQ